MSEIILGVDIGYGNTKSRNVTVASGVKKLASKPPIDTKTVEYCGNYYSVGGAKFSIQKSKVEDENTLILTMAVIAEEFKKLGITTGSIRLGVGLPLTRMGAEKTGYMDYMLKNRRLNFKYEGRCYSVYLISVDVFPQGYAAVINKLNTFSNSTVVIDIGSWTIDILPLTDGQPDLSRCKSLPLGTITAMNDINESLRQQYGDEADEIILKEVMINGTSNINTDYLRTIQDGLKQYTQDIMDNLRSLKFNLTLTQFVFIGGGATIMKHFLKDRPENLNIIEDVNINAKGYEDIMRHKYKAVG